MRLIAENKRRKKPMRYVCRSRIFTKPRCVCKHTIAVRKIKSRIFFFYVHITKLSYFLPVLDVKDVGF